MHAALEPVVLQAIHHIFTNSIMEFYEEVIDTTVPPPGRGENPDPHGSAFKIDQREKLKTSKEIGTVEIIISFKTILSKFGSVSWFFTFEKSFFVFSTLENSS